MSLLTYIRILLSARRMGLRDKGELEPFMVDGDMCKEVHTDCHTPARIGINGAGKAVHYCWRCEMILEEEADGPDDGEREPVLRDTDGEPPAHIGDNVFPLRKRMTG